MLISFVFLLRSIVCPLPGKPALSDGRCRGELANGQTLRFAIVEKGSARGARRAWTLTQFLTFHRSYCCDIRLFCTSPVRNEGTKPDNMEDDQQFCLRWNNHQSTLIQNFDTLLESGTLVDCTLAAEGKYLKAHKVVLSACSPYFEGLLSEHYDKHPVFILKDVKFKELKAMMDYMYRGEVNISQDQLAALLKAAESLQIKGLSESKTGGSSKTDSRQQKVVPQPTATSSDIPHASSGLTIEKNKVPRQGMAQGSVGDLPEDSASPQVPKGLSSREGSQSPTARKRKRFRRRSVGEDNSVENHEASNSSDMPQQMGVPALGIAPVADEKAHADPTDNLGRSALMTQLTKPADEMLQLPLEKPEPNDSLIEPKSEYLEDPEESVEDLTLDDDMNDLNEMEQDNNRAGPSHDPSQHPAGLGAWHVTGDRSNAGGVVGSVAGAPGTTDEVFLAAQEAAQAHRDSQGWHVDIPEYKFRPEVGTSKETEASIEAGASDSDSESRTTNNNDRPSTSRAINPLYLRMPIPAITPGATAINTQRKKQNSNLFIVHDGDKYVPVIEGPTFFCDFCGKRYAWPPLLDRHKLVCPSRPIVKKVDVEKKKRLKKKTKSERIVPSHEVSSLSPRAQRYKRRFAERRKDKRQKKGLNRCPNCDKSYLRRASLLRHKQNCINYRKSFVCTYCNYRTNYECNLKQHRLSKKHARNVSEATKKELQKEEAVEEET